MRITHKSRLLTLIGAAALVASTVSAVPAQANATGPLCGPAVAGVQSCGGTTSDGAPFAMHHSGSSDLLVEMRQQSRLQEFQQAFFITL